MYVIAFMLGGLIVTFLVSRLVRNTVLRKLPDPPRALASGAITLAITTVLGGFGMANGGKPNFVGPFALYFIPTAIWVVVDMWRDRHRAGSSDAPLT